MNKDNLLGIGSCGAKMILIGEHAVVYENPAIAMPFNGLKTIVTIYKSIGELTIDSMYHKGRLKAGSNTINGIIELINYVLNKINKPLKDLHFKIESNIIAQRGLGSSAAVSIAIIRAIYHAFDLELSDALLIELATFAEKIHHTNPSGLDVAVMVYQRPLWFKRNEAFKPIDINFEGVMMIIDSGVASQTKLAVEHVASIYKSKNAMVLNNFKSLEKLTFAAHNSLISNDITKMGYIMNDAQKNLANIEVSSKMLDDLCEKVVSYGALGAKLTGGGVGGCIIALTKTLDEAKAIKEKLIKDNITNVWISPLKELN